MHQYKQVYNSIHRYTPVYTGVYWYTQVYTSIQRYTQVHIGIHQYTQVCMGIHGYTHVYNGIHQYAQIHSKIKSLYLPKIKYMYIWPLAWHNKYKPYNSLTSLQWFLNFYSPVKEKEEQWRLKGLTWINLNWNNRSVLVCWYSVLWEKTSHF